LVDNASARITAATWIASARIASTTAILGLNMCRRGEPNADYEDCQYKVTKYWKVHTE
jgi:hypothetical protein